MFFFNKKKDIHQLSDEELIKLYQTDGEEAYVGVLYKRHSDKIYIVARKLVNDREIAQDIVMSVFEKIMTSLKTTDVQSFNNWLFIVTRNACNEYLRKRSNTVKKMEEWSDFQKSSSNNVENSPLEHLLLKEQDTNNRFRIQEAMDQLSIEQQTCIRLFYFEDKSYKEISDKTGYSDKEVKSYLQNGKKRLERLLNPDM